MDPMKVLTSPSDPDPYKGQRDARGSNCNFTESANVRGYERV